MKKIWQLSEAKKHLEEVIGHAQEDGTQLIVRDGEEIVVVLSYQEYQRLQLRQKKLSNFFRESPLAGIEIDLHRELTQAKYTRTL